jgi:hypothetical protein
VKSRIASPLLAFIIRNLFFFIPFLLWPTFHSPSAQNFELSASNQLEYSVDTKNHEDIFHNWFDFDWRSGLLDVGLRYEAHLPDDWGETYQELSYRYFQLSPESFELTVGNYYVMLGRGLILRSYENRDLRHDNNLDGVKGSIDLDGYDLSLLWGTPRGKYERTNDPLHAADAKSAIFDWMTLGGSYLRTDITNFGFVQLYGGNLGLTFPHLDFYGEYAKKDNPSGEEEDGDGIYLASNFYWPGLGLSLEYKDYQRFNFTHGEVTYNNPPSLTKEHLYTLLNRHAYILNLDDEKGFQVEAVSAPSDELSLLANYSYTTDHEDDLVFSEIYAEAEYDYQDKATVKSGFSRMENKKEGGFPILLAPVLDLTYYLSDRNSLAFLIEHLSTGKYDGNLTYYDQIISLSFSHSPIFSLTFTHERTTEWKTRAWSGKRGWFIGTLDCALGETHNLSLSIGSRRAGKVCSGGICTDRPALDGGEIKLLSRF